MENREEILLMNPHWEDGFFYPFPLKRKVFHRLKSAIPQPLILSLSGPRRVGKTVLMKQMINQLIEEGYPRRNILFFSLDEFSGNLLEILKEWEKIIGKKISGKNYFIFFDEIQNIEEWAKKLKIIYDTLGVKIFVSGSASMQIRKGSESLAGRILEFYVPPLFYEEYLMFSGKSKSDIKEKDWEEYQLYMMRQLPDLALYPTLGSKDYITSIVKKVIYEDVKKFFNVEETEVIDGIFKVICKDPGQAISVVDIAKDFGISRVSASNYLHALEKSYLIRKLYNYSKNPRKVETRAKKYYPHYTSLLSYSFPVEFGKIAETEVAWKMNAEFFWNERGKEIDLVIDGRGIEVKMRKRVDSSDVKWLIKNPIGLKERMVVVLPDAKINIKGIKIITLNEIDKFANYD
jgi:predicted AAA+ superfamily ATPase